jgi:hypothetical protein
VKRYSQEGKELVDSINGKIVSLQEKWIQNLSKLDPAEIKEIAKQSSWVKWVEKMNW